MNLANILQLAAALDPSDPRLELRELKTGGFYAHAARQGAQGASLEECLALLAYRLRKAARHQTEKLLDAIVDEVDRRKAGETPADLPSWDDC